MNRTERIREHLTHDPSLTWKELAKLTGSSEGHARRTRGRFFLAQAAKKKADAEYERSVHDEATQVVGDIMRIITR